VAAVAAMTAHTGDPPWGAPLGCNLLQQGHGMQRGGARKFGNERGWFGVVLAGS
jgi:hypothetical protein